MITRISFSDLMDNKKNIFKEIKEGFGQEGLGALLVTNIPNFEIRKNSMLTMVKTLGELSPDILKDYENPETNYSLGWSRGQEKLKKDIKDELKGSFYVDVVDKNKNKFPIPELNHECDEISSLMRNIGFEILKGCNVYLNRYTEFPETENYLLNAFNKKAKGRLLHYYEKNEKMNIDDVSVDNACSWHLDHGGLTILTRALYLDKQYNIHHPIGEGLHIKDKNRNIHNVCIPENSVLCQVGEMLQVLSGGYLRATPHCVFKRDDQNITRETYALFLDCLPEYDITRKAWFLDDFLENTGFDSLNNEFNLSLLKERHSSCKTYKEFVYNTLQTYYNI